MNQGEHNISSNPISHNSSFSNLSRRSSRDKGFRAAYTSGSHAHTHWCTVCEKPPQFQTCDGWKRHEKEQHESPYICMPNGHLDSIGGRPCCAFCSLQNPNDTHLATHHILQCTQKPVEDRRFNRKTQLVKHLKAHGILDGSDVADRWHVSYSKSYYSCGFCVALFTTNGERLNHIDTYHWRNHRNISDWDRNLVIRGLLLQTQVLASWNDLSLCDPRTTSLTWSSDIAVDLQARLEVSEERADDLAADAFYQCNLAAEPTPSLLAFEYPSAAPTMSQEPSLTSSWHNVDLEGMDFGFKDLQMPQSWSEFPDQSPTDDQSVFDAISPPAMPPSYTLPSGTPPPIHVDPGSHTTLFDSHDFSMSFTDTTVPDRSDSRPHYDPLTPARHSYPYRPDFTPSTAHCPPNTPATQHKKSPSIVAQMRRRLSRPRLREQAQAEPQKEMDIDLNNIMFSMRVHQGSRSSWRG